MKIKPGVRCRVVGGAIGAKHNLGQIVVVASFQGEHSQLGNIWRCTTEKGSNLITEYGGVGISADFAEPWLEIIPKDPPLPQADSLDRKLAA